MSVMTGVIADSPRHSGGGSPLPGVVKTTILAAAAVGPTGVTILAIAVVH